MTDKRCFSQYGWMGANACIPLLLVMALAVPAKTQTITEDGSVGTSVTNTSFFSVTEGTLRPNGNNSTLFHSFDTFSPESADVLFDLRDDQNLIDTSTVDTIIGRVTGSSGSSINGFLGIAQDAGTPTPDLFLINPNGIKFGSSAFISVPGSFVASTAESMLFENGVKFSALDVSGAPPLLTVSTPIGLQMGNNLGTGLSNSGIVYTSGTNTTAALIGNDASILFGGLYAESGHTEIGSIGPQAEVGLTPSSTGWAFDYGNVDNFSDIAVFGGTVNPSNRGSGSFQLVGDNIDIGFGSRVFAYNRGQASVNDSVIKAQDSVLLSGYSDPIFGEQSSLVFTYALAAGDAGNLFVEAPTLRLENRGQLSSFTNSSGNAGDITLQTSTLEASRIQDESFGTGIFSAAFASASGNGGNITIETDRLSLNNGAQILTRTFGSGNSGNIVVQAEEIAAGGSFPGNTTTSSGLRTSVESGATGTGGDLVLSADRLQLSGGGALAALTSGLGDAGSIQIDSGGIEIGGSNPTESVNSSIFSQANAGAEGNAGNITLTVDDLVVRDGGQILSRSFGQGDSGDIDIEAGTVAVSGATPSESFISVISATIESSGLGNAGDIKVRADSLTLSEGGQIVSESRTVGDAGDITLDVTDILVSGTTPSGITRSVVSTSLAETAQGTGGNIVVNSENLTISDRGELFAAVLLSEGNAGDITVGTNNLTLSDGGKIQSASNGKGNAGTIIINADGQIDISGAIPTDDDYSGIYATIVEPGIGNAGNIALSADQLRVREGGQITSGVRGTGDGGDISIDAREILIDGASPLGTNPSLISTSVESGGQGNAGNIAVTSNSLTLSDGGQLFASSSGIGNGGDITVNAPVISLTGTSPSDAFPSTISSRINPGAQGDGGNLNLTTERLSVSAAGVISTSTESLGNAGNITIKAEDVLVTGTNADEERRSFIVTSIEPTGTGTAGNIDLSTRRLQVTEGGAVSSSSFGTGNAGNVVILAEDEIIVSGTSLTEFRQSLIGAIAESGQGNAGNIDITTPKLSIREGGQIGSGTNSNGNGGNVTVDATDISVAGASPTEAFISVISTSVIEGAQGTAGDIAVDAERISLQSGGQFFSGTAGVGNGGNIAVRAEDILISGETQIGGNASTISTSVQSSGQGSAGDIDLTTNRLNIERGGAISSRTAGQGNAGDLSIEAAELIRLEGRSPSGDFASRISAEVEETAVGTGSNVTLTTERLEVLNGAQVTTGTAGEGAAGNITANVGSLLVQGTGSGANTGDNQPSRLTARSNSDFAAGSLLVTARDDVALRNGAELSVSSLFAGDAGNLGLSAESLRLTNGSRIEARTTAGSQGNIDLATNQLILLDEASQINTDATNTATGGNINIQSPLIIGNDNSDITANAIEGAGGNISITAEGLFGLRFRDRLTPASDITASSEVGLNGNVEIDLPVVDPTNALAQLPAVVLDPSDQIAAGCIADTGANFIATGRGGVPVDPSQGQLESVSLQAFELSSEGADAASFSASMPVPAMAATSRAAISTVSQEKALLEANGWQQNAQGEVQLMAVLPETDPMQNSYVSACLREPIG